MKHGKYTKASIDALQVAMLNLYSLQDNNAALSAEFHTLAEDAAEVLHRLRVIARTHRIFDVPNSI